MSVNRIEWRSISQLIRQRVLFLMLVCAILAGCKPNVPTQKVNQSSGPTNTVPVQANAPSVEASTTPTVLEQKMCSPLQVQPLEDLSQIITQTYLPPRQLESGEYSDEGHHGLDLGYYTREGALFTGTGVTAVFDGIVAGLVNDKPPYGNAIILESLPHQIPAELGVVFAVGEGESVYTLFAHLQEMQIQQLGEDISCGQQIAQTGLTGFTGGPHLHIEFRVGPSSTQFDSMGYYRADMLPVEMENYRLWRNSGTFRLVDPAVVFGLDAPQKQ